MSLSQAITSLEQHLVQLSAQLDQWAKTHNFTLQVITSLIAGLIFWLFFSYLPWRTRRKKLRPVVESALCDVYERLFCLFDAIMGHQSRSPSYYQAEIRSGKLTEEQIGIGLANKCLNDSYLYDKNVPHALMVIGRTIFDQCLAIDEVADKIISFNTYASAREVMLIEKIREQVRKYHFGERQVTASAKTPLGPTVLYPVNPTIWYRKQNFYEIYQLFCELQGVVLNKLALDRDRFLDKMQHLFHSGQYGACKKLIRANEHKFSRDRVLCNDYLALCERALGNTNKFYQIIETTYKLRPYDGLVSSRSTFEDLIGDNKLLEILAESHSAEEIAALKQSVRHDFEQKAAFERASKALSQYFRDKEASVLRGGN
jgi:hypothetical protein